MKFPKIDKKVITILTIVLFLIIFLVSISIRTQNLSLLVDSTTGKAIPTAVDPYYFLRVSKTILSGGLPELDSMRNPSLSVKYTQEILPYASVYLYKLMNSFGSYSIEYVSVLSPVIFFSLGLIVFFFLAYYLTKSKLAALYSTTFLAIIPTFLYRTMAGFFDHEAIGLLSLFMVFLSFIYSIKCLEKKNNSWVKIILLGLMVAFLSTLSIASWGGGAKLLFLVFSLSFFIFWLINYKTKDKEMIKAAVFYSIWVIFSVLFGFFFGIPLLSTLQRYFLSSDGLVGLFVMGFVLIDSFIKEGKHRIFYSIGTTLFLGTIGLMLIGTNPFELIKNIISILTHPFHTTRVGLTVAENSQPYFSIWRSQIGYLFLLFYSGILFIGIEICRKMKQSSYRLYLIPLWMLMISGILFSRYSANSILNGTNFISQMVYYIPIIIFACYIIKVYLNEDLKIDSELIILAALTFVICISCRSAIRIFFLIIPFVCILMGFFISKLIEYFKILKEKDSDGMIKIVLISFTVLILIFSGVTMFKYTKDSFAVAKTITPGANPQWQESMSWVRENTGEDSIFVHWWDYGYFIQTLGERRTLVDGGHASSYYDYLIGRYVLTTPNPETAMSFMKTHNITHLLIDPSDIGKYPAYSSIGSNDSNDRYSGIVAMVVDPKQIQETKDTEIRTYQGGYGVEEDIHYNEMFLPGATFNELYRPEFKTHVIGVILTKNNNGTLQQPLGVFLYKNVQYKIPLRYLEFDGVFYDFGEGYESCIKLIPKLVQNSQGAIRIDPIDALIYLNPRTFNSLVGQLYVLRDVQNKYPNLELVNSEQNYIIEALNSQGSNLPNFVFFQGLRSSLDIWEYQDSENILINEEYLRTK